jgi:hypothetical protein
MASSDEFVSTTCIRARFVPGQKAGKTAFSADPGRAYGGRAMVNGRVSSKGA